MMSTAKQRRIGFIGSRDTSQFESEWLELFTSAAARCAKNGCIIQTGAAQGCDQLAARAALEVGGSVELFLPWYSYEVEWISEMEESYADQLVCRVYNPQVNEEWLNSVALYHPKPERMSLGVHSLHARNYGIIKNTMCVIVLPGIVRPGGTGQGIRIAEALKIPLYNLTTAKGRDDLTKRLGNKKTTELPPAARGPLSAEFVKTFPEE